MQKYADLSRDRSYFHNSRQKLTKIFHLKSQKKSYLSIYLSNLEKRKYLTISCGQNRIFNRNCFDFRHIFLICSKL